MDDAPQSFVVTLAPAELDAAAARYGLRAGLGRGLTAQHLAPLAAFTLAVLFAAILALTSLVSRRAGEMCILVAASLFLIQRLVVHRRLWSARTRGRKEVERLLSGQVATTIQSDGVVQTSGTTVRRLAFADCEDVEEANGLIYLWAGPAVPVVLPTRALPDGEAARLKARIATGAARARIEEPA